MSKIFSRSARGSVNQLPCVFAVVLNAREAVCSLSVHEDGKDILCSQPLARAHCAQIDGVLRQTLRFLLQERSDPLAPNSKAAHLRVQGQGLHALCQILDPAAHAVDVQRLLERVETLPGGIGDLPLAELLRVAGSRPLPPG
jgi:hypothetical protein